MAIIWQNTFDGTSGNINVPSSSNYGDPITSVVAPAVFQSEQRKHGAGAAQVGHIQIPGSVTFPVGVEADAPWSVRFYFYLPSNGALICDYSTPGFITPFRLVGTNAAPSAYNSFLGGQLVTNLIPDIQDRWVRYEYFRTGVEGVSSYHRLWWTNPEDDSEGSWDHQVSGSGLGQQVDALTITGRFISGTTHAATGGYFDSIAVGDEPAQIGPVVMPNEIVWQNTFDGPDLTTMTPANSENYGDPVAQVTNAVAYSTEWAALGSASVALGSANGATSGNFTTTSASQVDWSLRAYVNVPEDGWQTLRALAGGGQRFLWNLDGDQSTYEILGQNVSAQSANLVGQPVRIEVTKVGLIATARLWWTSVNDPDGHDLQVQADVTNWDGLTGVYIEGGGFSTPPSRLDELATSMGGWIGPAQTGSGAETSVLFSAEVVGTADTSGFVDIDTLFSGEAEGVKRGTSGTVTHDVLYASEVEHDAREVGLARGEVVYQGRAEGRSDRTTAAPASVEYSGDIEWETARVGDVDADVTYLPEVSGESRVTLPDVVRPGLRYRLVAYDPNGIARGQLPLPLSFQMGVPLNDLPSLSLEYLRSAPRSALLDNHCEVAVEISTLTSPTFEEYPGCRFINVRTQNDPSDRSENSKYTMPHYGWQLRKARVLVGLDEEGQRSFANATFGSIMHTFLTEAQERGWNPGMSWDFTAQRDSGGQLWDQVYTVSFDAGQDLWSILESFGQQMAVDFQFHRRTLRMFNVDTALNRDRTNQAILHLGRDITSAPNDWTSEELASRVLVRGDEGSSVMMAVASAQRPWGDWENYVSQSGVTDTGTLTALARWTLEKSRQPLVQMTRGILFPTAEYMPFRDYQPGDYITAPGDPEEPWDVVQQDQLRVRQITLVSLDGQGMEGALVLNERFIEANLRRDRQLNALTGGAGASPGGGGGGRPPSEDTRNPRAPQGLVVNSETYINEIGEPRGQITATWQLVDEATNGTPMDINSYEVWVRWAAAGQPWQLWTTVDDPTNQAFMSPFNPDEVYEVRVRAVARNLRRSAYSGTVPILVQGDAEPPAIPSAPVLESRLGVVRATWNGLDFQGIPMAPDFDYVAVWMSETASEEDGWERIDTLYRQGVSVIPDLAYDTPFYFRFTAIDRSGNESEPSSISSISVQQLVPGDITPGSIGYELLAEGAVRDDILADDAVRNRHVAAGQITGEKIRAYSIFADRIAVGNTRNLLTDPKNLDEDLNDLRLDLSEGVWTYENNSAHSQNSPTLSRSDNSNGTYRYYWVQSVEAESVNDLNAGYRVQAEIGRAVSTTLVTLSGRTSGVAAVAGFVRLLNREGTVIGQLGTTTEVSLNSNVNDYELISGNGAEIPPSAVSAIFYIRVVLSGVNDGATISFARPFSALNDGQVLIENGAITANKIAANSITADKIVAGSITAVAIAADAITTDKLAANAITAKHTITGALIQTTASANRGLKIRSTGLQGFDNLGNETFSYTSSNGLVRTTGRFQSGISTGNNVVIDSGLYAGRPAIQLNTGNSSQLQPVMYSMGAGSSEYDPGSLVIHGRENTINSSGRNTLQLKAGSGAGASLSQEFGDRAGVGFSYANWELYLRGRFLQAQHRLDRQILGRTSASTSSSDPFNYTWTITYGQAAPNGGRLVQVSPFSRNVANLASSAVVVNNYLGTTVLSVRKITVTTSSYSLRAQYLSSWTDQSWSSA